jgi:CRISPR/Cas system CMR subunit Cmr6 (Cas7 group RAMP superfamily)
MCVKLADHKTTVYVHMFNSCFHLEHASQDRDILELNLYTPHYQKYKNYETFKSCYIHKCM